jgi:hypothetical protein
MFSKTKIALSAALILGTASVAFAENNAVPGERNPSPVASKVFEGRNAFEGRAEVVRPQIQSQAVYGPASSPSIYGGGF